MSELSPLESIFFLALATPPAERAAFLTEACGGDEELRRRVEKMLAAQAEAGSFLEVPPPALAPADATIDQALEKPGTAIGPYKLLQQIGEGGFGVVYMAEQLEPVRRKVALKVIKPGMDTRQVIARFEAERQALAVMDHPHIARVFDAGTTESGRPYFVMELVRGIPITQYCDENNLPIRERLELFAAVCRAIQHAHTKGIIHRDIKPTNVLVTRQDGQSVVKVIDFGVAKAMGQQLTEKTLFTEFAQMIGTPLYMSPEQAELSSVDIDTRSDIYSLGVLLYELLTGTTPVSKDQLKKAAFDEIRRIIREDEPPKPSTRLESSRHAPCAVSGSGTRSVPTTLASIAAVRGTEPAKLTKLVRGELDWIVMKALEKDRNRRYETASAFAKDVQRYLADEPVQACPPSAGYRLRKFARRNKSALTVVGLILFFLVLLGGGVGWAVRDRSAREAEAARQQAARHAKVAGQVESILADVDRLENEQKWREALAAARRAEAAVAGGEADGEITVRVRQRLKDLAFIERLEQILMEQKATWGTGTRLDSAREDREYARAFRDYGVDVDELAVETSIQRLASRPALALPLAVALDAWIGQRREASKADDAGCNRLVAIARGIDPEPVRDRLRSMSWPLTPESLDELRRLAESIDVRAHHPATLFSLEYTLAWHCWTGRALQEGPALQALRIRILREAQVAYPRDFLLTTALAGALLVQGDREGALRFYTAALSLRPDAPPRIYHNFRVLLREQGSHDEVIAVCRRQIDIVPDRSLAYGSLAEALRAVGKLDEAIDAYRKAIEINPKNGWAYLGRGNALRARGKPGEAIPAYKKAIELNPKMPEAHNNLAWLLATCSDPNSRNPGQAVAHAQKAVELSPTAGHMWNTLGAAHYRAGNWKEAIMALERPMGLRKGGDSFDWFFLAMAHWQLGEHEKAREWYDKAVEWMDKNQPKNEELRRFRAEAEELLELKGNEQDGT